VAMEWGWLELWLKMGVLGPLAFIFIAYELIRRLWSYKSTDLAWLGYALISIVVFLYATHVFSPYLNHPIGLGLLLFVIPFLPAKKQPALSNAVPIKKMFEANKLPGLVTTKTTSE